MARQQQIQRKRRGGRGRDCEPEAAWAQPRYELGQDKVAGRAERVLSEQELDAASRRR